MNREIKFRIWNKRSKRFVQEDTDVDNRRGYNLGEYAISPNGDIYFYEQHDGGMDVLEPDDLERSQFTGLEDKNGKEIYEGDIVIYEYTYNEAMESSAYGNGEVCDIDMVEWYEGRYILNRKGLSSKMYFLFDDYKELKVIGNIFENPELLNNA